jgi:Na+/H+ antiporter NhaB
MITGGWLFVGAAYAVAALGLCGLVVAVVAHALHWRKLERAIDDGQP